MHILIIEETPQSKADNKELSVKGFPQVKGVFPLTLKGVLSFAVAGIKQKLGVASTDKPATNYDWNEYVVEVPRALAGKFLQKIKLAPKDRIKFKPTIIQDH